MDPKSDDYQEFVASMNRRARQGMYDKVKSEPAPNDTVSLVDQHKLMRETLEKQQPLR